MIGEAKGTEDGLEIHMQVIVISFVEFLRCWVLKIKKLKKK